MNTFEAFVSSASTVTVEDVTESGKLFTNIRNKMGPRTLPKIIRIMKG